MKISEHGLQLIKRFEGLRLQAYRDGAGVWTIGYGTTRHDGRRVGELDTCTQEQAAEWLAADVAGAENAVNAAVKVPMTQNQFDALVSLAYNVGCGAFGESTLLREVNAGYPNLAAVQFRRWNLVAGVPSEGLTGRREAEAALFLMA